MEDIRLQQQLLDLRIKLEELCDGFDKANNSKKCSLTLRTRFLFLLSQEESLSPNYFIKRLGIAKSNLTLLCRGLLKEGVIEKTKNEQDKRGIYYKITEKGQDEVNEYLYEMKEKNPAYYRTAREKKTIERKMDNILEFLRRRT